MKAKELGPFWLRERAKTLREAADKVEGAYSGDLAIMCDEVACAYRNAATLLESAARGLEISATEDP